MNSIPGHLVLSRRARARAQLGVVLPTGCQREMQTVSDTATAIAWTRGAFFRYLENHPCSRASSLQQRIIPAAEDHPCSREASPQQTSIPAAEDHPRSRGSSPQQRIIPAAEDHNCSRGSSLQQRTIPAAEPGVVLPFGCQKASSWHSIAACTCLHNCLVYLLLCIDTNSCGQNC